MEKKFEFYIKNKRQPMRPVTLADIENPDLSISISEPDKLNGSPRIGDMIAINPDDQSDRWLVAEKFFKDNYVKDETNSTSARLSTPRERVVDEKEQLDIKLKSLDHFIHSPAFNTIEHVQKSFLKTQLHAMTTYSKILEERLTWWD